MGLKEHQPGCGCASCQNNTQYPVDNIDGYASGFELAPDLDQELSPELMGDPDFMSNIINQVLQQMYTEGGGIEEQQFINNDQISVTPEKEKYEKLPGNKWKDHILHNPCGDQHHALDTFAQLDKDLGAGGYLNPVNTLNPGIATNSVQQTMGEDKIREYIASQINALSEDSLKLEGECNCNGEVHEGSCGYSQSSPNGDELNSPGGTVGMEAKSRTNKMKIGNLKEKGPRTNSSVQTTQTYMKNTNRIPGIPGPVRKET